MKDASLGRENVANVPRLACLLFSIFLLTLAKVVSRSVFSELLHVCLTSPQYSLLAAVTIQSVTGLNAGAAGAQYTTVS